MPALKGNQLAVRIAKKEGHKSETRIGDIAEVIGLIADEMYNDVEVTKWLTKLGITRAKRKKKV